PDVLEFFLAMGIPICELWGLSETTCVATINPPERIKIGTVGTPLPGVELRVAGDGELFVRGEIVMAGYRNQPQQTAEAIVAEAIGRANQRLSRVEQVKRFRLLDDEWEPGGDELTPTMKLRRGPIAAQYAEEIEALYRD